MEHTAYVNPDGNPDHKGLAYYGTDTNGAVFYGIQGTVPINMQCPHRIVATFYNKSVGNKTFQPRVSFKDINGPVAYTNDKTLDCSWTNAWYQMYPSTLLVAASGGMTLSGNSQGEIHLNITDKAHVDAPLSPATCGSNYLVNISLKSFNTDLVLTKIELSDEQDVTPPTTPSNLTATAISPSLEASNCVVKLTWTPSTDDQMGVDRYNVYRNDGTGWVLHEMVSWEWTDYFGTNTIIYRDYQVKPNTEYTYAVEAVDAEVNGVYRTLSGTNAPRGNMSAPAFVTITTPSFNMPALIDATADLLYLGRFRVPASGNWDGIGRGLTYNPQGNPNYNPNTELPGSLLITGRDNESTVAEFTIAKPIVTDTIQVMNQAVLLKPFTNAFTWEIQKQNTIWNFVGYHPGDTNANVGPHLYGSQYEFYNGYLTNAHLSLFDLDLTSCFGPWHIGSNKAPGKLDFRFTGKLIFPAPQAWADTYTGGRSLIIGNGGAVSGYGTPSTGPALYAVKPWESGGLPDANGIISAVKLLCYGDETEDETTWHDNWNHLSRAHCASWAMGDGKQAVIVSGAIGRGDIWYGAGDGAQSTTSSYDEPDTITEFADLAKGYHATLRDGSLMLFNPADLARVVLGDMQPYEPRYYQTFNVRKYYLLNQDSVGIENVSIACDQENGYLYVHEKDGETSVRSLMHVFKIRAGGANNQAPTVDAGTNQSISLSGSASLDGTGSDDGEPSTPGAITFTWSKVSGPGTVTFGTANAADTTASFSQAGTYVLRLQVSDSELTTVDTVTITVNPENTAPTVNAGTDQTITNPASANLNGTVSDDGLPNPPAALTYTWSKVSGPGTVTFGNANAVDTTASFSAAGTYVLQLQASDSVLSNVDTVTITVVSQILPTGLIAHWKLDDGSGTAVADATGNGSAGTNNGATWTTGYLNGALDFDGVSDEAGGAFFVPIAISTQMSISAWVYSDVAPNTADSVVSLAPVSAASLVNLYSSGKVTAYGDRNLVTASVTPPSNQWYHLAYTYDGKTNRVYINGVDRGYTTNAPDTNGVIGVFRLGNRARFGGKAFDGRVDDVRVYDYALSAGQVMGLVSNAAPTVNAGLDQAITLPASANLAGTFSDDGMPNPPAATTATWSKVSGPGTVTFGDANATNTTAAFSAEGTYVLQLQASDGELSVSDTVTVTVSPMPTVQFSATSSTGDEATASVNLAVTLSAASSNTVTVSYAVTGGTATGSGTDYSISGTPLTFNPGETSQNVSITVTNDALDENDETVVVTLSSSTNATLGVNTAHTYTIQDNDDAPVLQFSSDSSSGDESVTPVNLAVTLSAASAKSVTVQYAVTGGTATGSGTDYSISGTPLTFNPGETSLNVPVTVANDALDEDDETVVVTLSSPGNATLGANTEHTYTIPDNDDAPVVQFSAASSSGDESVAAVNLAVTLSAASAKSVTVQYAVTGGTATGSGTDYSISGTPLTFNPGETSLNVPVTVANDALDEDDETVVVTLSSPGNATLGANTEHTYTIQDNDDAPVVQFSAASSSGDESVATVNLAVTLSAASAKSVTVNYAVTGGTATGSGTDYSISGTPLTFSPGETSQNVSITVTNDALDEDDETVVVTLSSPGNATLGANTDHTYTIQDNDAAPEVQFTAVSSSGDEAVATVNLAVTLSAASAKSVTVNYAVTGGTATGSGTDYSVSGTQLTFTPGETSLNVPVTVANDALDEDDETVVVTLSSPGNATLGANTGHTYTIQDNDDAPVVQFSAASSSGGESVASVNLAVTLSASSAKSVTVQYAVTGGTATGSGTDYSISGTPLTFSPGETSQNVSITVTNDALDENDETVVVTLSSPTNATLGANSAHTYTIQDDDTTPPTFVALGSGVANTGASSVPLPAGLQTNDILLLFLETANQAISINNQNGGTWTQVTGSPQGTGIAGGTNGTRLTVFWSRYNGSQGAPTITDSGDHQIGRIMAIRGATTSGDPCDVTAGGVEDTADTSGSITGATTTVANTLVVVAVATSLPDATSSYAKFSGWTNANLSSLTERIDFTSTPGNGGGLATATGVKATAGAYGATAVTLVNAAHKGLMSIAIKP